MANAVARLIIPDTDAALGNVPLPDDSISEDDTDHLDAMYITDPDLKSGHCQHLNLRIAFLLLQPMKTDHW